MWQPGFHNYSDGSLNYSSLTKSVGLPQKLLGDGMANIAPFCELKERPQADLAPTESLRYTASATTLSHWITCPIYKQKWLGNSTEPLSDCDHMIINVILHLRTALPSGGFFRMVLATLLAFGIATWKGSPKILHLDNSHPVVQLLRLHH
jgi:hypothetical protein